MIQVIHNMSRISPPLGFTSWNKYIERSADISADQSIEGRRLIKRNIKLGLIASVERYANGDITNFSYRPYNNYVSPGTTSLATGHPWLLRNTVPSSILLLEDGSRLLLENGDGISIVYSNVSTSSNLLLEDGSRLLLENGDGISVV
jgi:hypothetical protein